MVFLFVTLQPHQIASWHTVGTNPTRPLSEEPREARTEQPSDNSVELGSNGLNKVGPIKAAPTTSSTLEASRGSSGDPISAKVDEVAEVELTEMGPTYFVFTDATSATQAVNILTVVAGNVSLKIFVPDKDV